MERGGAGRPRHAGQHGRRRPRARAVVTDEARLSEVDAALAAAAPLPRSNGELVFDEPWQGRALGMGVLVLEQTGTGWDEWRERLSAAIARHGFDPDEPPATAYYAAWLDALEGLVQERGLA